MNALERWLWTAPSIVGALVFVGICILATVVLPALVEAYPW